MSTFKLNKNSKENFEDTNQICIICNKKLKNISSNNICKSCKRKIYATNIIKELELYNIKPNIPFKKEDLERLNFHKIKVQDYIWTLLEMNLINENPVNNTYSLKDEETINKFINKYEKYSKNYDRSISKKEVKKQILSKKCKLCNKELSVNDFYKSIASDDGYDDYCKLCKSSIKAASYLQNLLKFIKPEEKFKLNTLEEHYPNKLELQGQIWNLQEKDLISSEEDNTIFYLVNKVILDKYLEKYLIEDSTSNEIKRLNYSNEKYKSNTKICPICNHEVNQIEINCKYCGHKFIKTTSPKIDIKIEEKRNNLINYLKQLTDDEEIIKNTIEKINSDILTSKNQINTELVKIDLLEYLKTQTNDINIINNLTQKINYNKIITKSQINAEINNELKEELIKYLRTQTKDEVIIKNMSEKINKNIISTKEEVSSLLKKELNNYLIIEKNNSNIYSKEKCENNEKINYFVSYKDKKFFEIMIKGMINNKKTFEFLHTLETFEDCLKRVITYKIDKKYTKILVELKSENKNWNKTLKQLNANNWDKI